MQFRVEGVDATSGKATPTIEVDAPDERDAATLAKIRGVLPTRITPVAELLTIVKEPKIAPDGSQTKRTTLVSIEGRPLWFAATLVVGLLIAAIWYLVGGDSQPLRSTEPITVARTARTLELDGWRFVSDELIGSSDIGYLRTVTYARMFDDLRVVAELNPVTTADESLSSLWISVRGPADHRASKYDAYLLCAGTISRIIPETAEALDRAFETLREVDDEGAGVPRAQGVATSLTGWRVQITDYLTYYRDDDNAVILVTASRKGVIAD